MIEILAIILAIYLALGVLALLVTIFGLKAVPRGRFAWLNAIGFVVGWVIIGPLLWFEILEKR